MWRLSGDRLVWVGVFGDWFLVVFGGLCFFFLGFLVGCLVETQTNFPCQLAFVVFHFLGLVLRR